VKKQYSLLLLFASLVLCLPETTNAMMYQRHSTHPGQPQDPYEVTPQEYATRQALSAQIKKYKYCSSCSRLINCLCARVPCKRKHIQNDLSCKKFLQRLKKRFQKLHTIITSKEKLAKLQQELDLIQDLLSTHKNCDNCHYSSCPWAIKCLCYCNRCENQHTLNRYYQHPCDEQVEHWEQRRVILQRTIPELKSQIDTLTSRPSRKISCCRWLTRQLCKC